MYNDEKTLIAWADLTIKSWSEKITKLGLVKRSGELNNSFKHHLITASGGDVKRIRFSFALHGLFQDMGVGSGASLQTRDSSVREPIRWMSSELYRQSYKLIDILVKKYSEASVAVITKSLSN